MHVHTSIGLVSGFVDPSDPTAKTRFLAPEKLRGVGGILLSHHGRRFVDELATREHVVRAITALHSAHGLMPTGPMTAVVFLVLPEAAAQAYGMAAIQFYCAKGLFKAVQGTEGVAAEIGCAAETIQQEFLQYDRYCSGVEHDVDFGKRVFPCAMLGSRADSESESKSDASPSPTGDTFFVARVSCVTHYCMGGVSIDAEGRVLAEASGAPIAGLFAAGEVTGGLHGRNRLGGNSLLECVVFGRRCAHAVLRQVRSQRGAADRKAGTEAGAETST